MVHIELTDDSTPIHVGGDSVRSRRAAARAAARDRPHQEILAQLESIMPRHGYAVVDVAVDGNCMLHALKRLIPEADAMKTKAIRKRLITWLEQHGNDPMDDGKGGDPTCISSTPQHIDNEMVTWETYLKCMRKDGAWCDGTMLLAAAMAFKRTIGYVSTAAPGRLAFLPEQCHRSGDDWNHAGVVLGCIDEYHWTASAPVSGHCQQDPGEVVIICD